MIGQPSGRCPGGVERGPPFGNWYSTRPKTYEPPGYGIHRPRDRFPMPPVNPGPNVMGLGGMGWRKLALLGAGAYVLYKVL